MVQGDGACGDGPEFHWDYYNSFVIHPMLLDVARCVQGRVAARGRRSGRRVETARAGATPRSRSGSSRPTAASRPIGRSIAYRCGAFHLLAQAALRASRCPTACRPAQVRGALTAVIRRTLEAPERSTRTAGCASASAATSPASKARTTSRRRGKPVSRAPCWALLPAPGLPRRRLSSGHAARSRGRRSKASGAAEPFSVDTRSSATR